MKVYIVRFRRPDYEFVDDSVIVFSTIEKVVSYATSYFDGKPLDIWNEDDHEDGNIVIASSDRNYILVTIRIVQ